MKIVILAAAVFAAPALAANDLPPVNYSAPIVIMHRSGAHFTFVVGENPLDQPSRFNCSSAAGCLIIASASEAEANNDTGVGIMICAVADGVVKGVPGCDSYNDMNRVKVSRQILRVSQGPHTIQTIIHSDNHLGMVTGWETDYLIYNRPVS